MQSAFSWLACKEGMTWAFVSAGKVISMRGKSFLVPSALRQSCDSSFVQNKRSESELQSETCSNAPRNLASFCWSRAAKYARCQDPEPAPCAEPCAEPHALTDSPEEGCRASPRGFGAKEGGDNCAY